MMESGFRKRSPRALINSNHSGNEKKVENISNSSNSNGNSDSQSQLSSQTQPQSQPSSQPQSQPQTQTQPQPQPQTQPQRPIRIRIKHPQGEKEKFPILEELRAGLSSEEQILYQPYFIGISNSSCPWNGSDLGELPNPLLEFRISTSSKRKFWILDINIPSTNSKQLKTKILVSIKSIKTLDPVIADELKPLFGLTKIGSHTGSRGMKKFLLLRVENEPQVPLPLYLEQHEKIVTPNLFLEIQKIYIFRSLLNLNSSFDSSIVVRNNQPISFVENSFCLNENKPSISATAIKKWFPEENYGDILFQMIQSVDLSDPKISKSSMMDTMDVMDKINRLEFLVEDLINRIDKERISLVKYLIFRVSSRICGGKFFSQ